MDYQILDELWEKSEERRETYQQQRNVYVMSKIEEVGEPFNGSAGTIKLYIFNNYISQNGIINLAIVIRDTFEREDAKSGFAIHNVEQAIFPLYATGANSFDIPPSIEAPDLPREAQVFIFEKRKLPKVPREQAANQERHEYKWTINQLAEHLHMSNRRIAQFCRAKGI